MSVCDDASARLRYCAAYCGGMFYHRDHCAYSSFQLRRWMAAEVARLQAAK